MIFTMSIDGYYDEHGNWQRTKFCFMDCGERCTCRPPRGVWKKPLLDGEACDHPGCLSHVSHPCEGCGRIAGKSQI